jgi:hypothetical protein
MFIIPAGLMVHLPVETLLNFSWSTVGVVV